MPAAFSPDEKSIMSGSDEQSVQAWDASSIEESSSESNTSSVQPVALSFNKKGIVPCFTPRITWVINNDCWILMKSFPFNKLLWIPLFLGFVYDAADLTKLIISCNGQTSGIVSLVLDGPIVMSLSQCNIVT